MEDKEIKKEIESILNHVYNDTFSKWSSHSDVEYGISEYADEIMMIFQKRDETTEQD